MVLKATTVDQEQDRGSDIRSIHTDQTMLPTNNIDLVEKWYLDRLEDCYAYSERHIKCPFFRQRCGDILDDIEGFVRFCLIRPYFEDSSSRLGPLMSCKSLVGEGQKTKHLPVRELLDILRKDW
jgi:hypothetical protein